MTDEDFDFASDDERVCLECHGEGAIVLCIDDLCYRQEVCIHGDPPTPCSECKGSGYVSEDDS